MGVVVERDDPGVHHPYFVGKGKMILRKIEHRAGFDSPSHGGLIVVTRRRVFIRGLSKEFFCVVGKSTKGADLQGAPNFFIPRDVPVRIMIEQGALVIMGPADVVSPKEIIKGMTFGDFVAHADGVFARVTSALKIQTPITPGHTSKKQNKNKN